MSRSMAVDPDARSVRLNAGTPNGNGVYSGSLTYNALADGASHTYSFFSVGIDDEQKAQVTPTTPDVYVQTASPLQLARGRRTWWSKRVLRSDPSLSISTSIST